MEPERAARREPEPRVVARAILEEQERRFEASSAASIGGADERAADALALSIAARPPADCSTEDLEQILDGASSHDA